MDEPTTRPGDDATPDGDGSSADYFPRCFVFDPAPDDTGVRRGGPRPAGDPHAAAFAFEARLRDAHPWPVVTPLLAAATVGVFLLSGLTGGGWAEARRDRLFDWGAAYGPRTLGGEWWRALTAPFLHGGLSHLAGNVCLLLLVGRLAERLLGPAVFLGVYLFAGVGGGLLAVGWFPTAVQVGASGAVFGVYGALLGCYLRGWRVIPRRVVGRAAAVLLVFTAVSLLDQWLTRERALVAHLGGAACGFAAGFLLGPSCRLRDGRAGLRLAVFLALAGLATWGLARLAALAARQPVELLAPLDDALGRERRLLARFHEAEGRWADGDLTDDGLRDVLRNDLIPEWRKMREDCNLRLPDEDRLPGSLLAELRRERVPRRERPADRPPPTPGAVLDLFRLSTRARLEAWTAFADSLGDRRMSPDLVTDLLTAEALRAEVDELANDGNPLRVWVEFSRAKLRERERDRPGTKK